MRPNRLFLLLWLILLFGMDSSAQSKEADQIQPNVIIIFVDDLGYGDLSSFGHPTIKTPNIDKMAQEGVKLTQFYVGASICTPSRAALLTGRLPVRSGMAGSENSGNVLYPRSTGGLPQSEITLAEAVREQGYTTGIIGKWHLGHLPEFLPLNHGFDYYFGIPYSNDMVPPRYKKAPELPLYENHKIIESDPDQNLLTRRYTEKAIEFIKENKDQPFFLYYPNNFPHTPLHASNKFENSSKRGLYGDVVQEIDWSVGEILKTLKQLEIDKNTLVVFTSDNGPWLKRRKNGGSAGLLYEGKASTYEGGFRVPAVVRWPGEIPDNQITDALTSTMDFFPTIMKLAGSPLPKDRRLDGVNIMPLLKGEKKQANDVIYYYLRDKLYAIRKGSWKAHFITKASYSKEAPKAHDPPLLYNIDEDPSEKYEVGAKFPEKIEEIKRIYKEHQLSLEPVKSQLDLGY
ncbi:sulfatase family protein [Salegentibacter sp. F14]